MCTSRLAALGRAWRGLAVRFRSPPEPSGQDGGLVDGLSPGYNINASPEQYYVFDPAVDSYGWGLGAVLRASAAMGALGLQQIDSSPV